MNRHRITIHDLAEKLGVSTSTVSRALRNLPEVNEETKKKVRELAKKLGYRPNLLASGLRNQCSKIIGVIVPDLESAFFVKAIKGINDACKKQENDIFICQSNESMSQEKMLLQILTYHRVDGILISLSRETNSYNHIKKCLDYQLPLVMFDRVKDDLNCQKVVIDDEHSAFQATEYLQEKGYEEIIFLSGPSNLNICKNRSKGYLSARGNSITNIFSTDFSSEKTSEAVRAILNEGKPDAILCINDKVAVDTISVLKKMGYKVPEQIAVMGFSNDSFGEIVEPSLTTVEQYPYKMGYRAAELLLDEINNKQVNYKKPEVLNTTIIIRASA